ncbi:hypothetical protein ACIQVR_39795 [Streptomyces xanthochromogenes]|uniref:hypothetical protein n=1 Tax=Streptomyces xanthochromogenes TaxID=67384 RepID=UPI0037FFF5C0
MSTLRDEIAETLGAHRNGPASDGRGWFRTDEQRAELYAEADAILAAVTKTDRLINQGDVYQVIETDWLDGNDEHKSFTVYTQPHGEAL